MFASTPSPPYVAVIFTFVRKGESDEVEHARMAGIAASRPGYLGGESVRGADGRGIIVSYWADRARAAAWKREAGQLGVDGGRRFHDYRVRIATVHEDYGPAGVARGTGPAEQFVQTAYDEMADAYADTLTGVEAEDPIDLAMLGYLVSVLDGPREVLDAGCGAGRLLPVLAGLGCQVQGVDLSPDMVRRAWQDHPTFDTRVGSLTDLPFDDASFDGVVSWYSTIHTATEDLPQVAAELRRVLRPSGKVLVAFQTGRGTRRVGSVYGQDGDIVLERYLRTVDDMIAVLGSAGMAEMARLERAARSDHERDGQAFLIVGAP